MLLCLFILLPPEGAGVTSKLPESENWKADPAWPQRQGFPRAGSWTVDGHYPGCWESSIFLTDIVKPDSQIGKTEGRDNGPSANLPLSREMLTFPLLSWPTLWCCSLIKWKLNSTRK